jgi:chromosome segregation ATPase
MSAGELKGFDAVVERLTADLAELESVSDHLANVKEYADKLKGADKRVSATLDRIQSQAQGLLRELQGASKVFRQELSDKTGRMEAVLGKMLEFDYPTLFRQVEAEISSIRENSDTVVSVSSDAKDAAEKAQSFCETFGGLLNAVQETLDSVNERTGTVAELSAETSRGVSANQELCERHLEETQLLATRTKDLERSLTLLQAEVANVSSTVKNETEKTAGTIGQDISKYQDALCVRLDRSENRLLELVKGMDAKHDEARADLRKSVLVDRYLSIVVIVGLAILTLLWWR